jgi:hypothetical protein
MFRKREGRGRTGIGSNMLVRAGVLDYSKQTTGTRTPPNKFSQTAPWRGSEVAVGTLGTESPSAG